MKDKIKIIKKKKLKKVFSSYLYKKKYIYIY